MKVKGDYKFDAPGDVVWEAMVDPDMLERCIPGCKKLTRVGEDEYKSNIEMGIAAIKGNYASKTTLKNKMPPESYTLELTAEGPTGIVNVLANIKLSDKDGETFASYDGEATMSGLIAGVGQRMLSGAAKFLIGQFFKNMAKEIRAAYAER